MRLELDDHGTVDVLLPPLLTVTRSGADGFRIAAVAAGRDAAQVGLALQRELDAAGVGKGSVVTLAQSSVNDAVVAAAIARGAQRVLLDGQTVVQVHPRLFAEPERKGDKLLLRAAPDADAAIVAAQIERELQPLLAAQGELGAVTVTLAWPDADPASAPFARAVQVIVGAKPARLLLDAGAGKPQQLFPEIVREYVSVVGRKEDAAPPLVMLGIESGAEATHAEKVLAKLQDLAPLIDGRRVLLLMHSAGRDAAIRDDDPLVAAVRTFVDQRATATLAFRGNDPHRRPFFEVVHSQIAGLAAGARFADPRPRRA
jgi:hypothetical protein